MLDGELVTAPDLPELQAEGHPPEDAGDAVIYHFVEDPLHRYAIVEEHEDGSLEVATTAVEPEDLDAAVRHLKEDGHQVFWEEHSGKKPIEPENTEEPYPVIPPRRAF